MLINTKKTKVMEFNRCSKMDFSREVSLSDNVLLEQVDSIKLLGVMISDSLKWDENTEYICKKTRSKLFLLRSMKRSGLTNKELVDAYIKEIRL